MACAATVLPPELEKAITLWDMCLSLPWLFGKKQYEALWMRGVACTHAGVVQVRGHYRAVPYHNFFHCVDVTHATFRFIRLAGGRARMAPAEKLALMVAALCHDMDHPGTGLCLLPFRYCAQLGPHTAYCSGDLCNAEGSLGSA